MSTLYDYPKRPAGPQRRNRTTLTAMSRTKVCSMCRGPRDRPGQTYCRNCHADYMRQWRAERVVTPAAALDRIRQELAALQNDGA